VRACLLVEDMALALSSSLGLRRSGALLLIA
jgi:hypothetical protein